MPTRLRPFPARRISSPYGWRCRPGSTTKSFHLGTDYQVPGGTAVRACEAGTVSDVRYDAASGHTITILHAGGWSTKYHHLRHEASVAVGQPVDAGQVIGYVGHTGTAAHGDHLHLEAWRNGRHADPETYFEEVDTP
ncbi:M23 family metallopeptidase [Microterricola viridarii]|uniref:M23ase beta-sheet core domain-containing protein n=1 Tax=Microterricola viridarii TaxID=412690 RepID=A0A109QWK8_9MICO|nr:M23 family metallopeptidase [Microterricola viridarii]AMB58234.1 hypothetical protein AWU67_04525 [Microterricola viridarii]